MTATLHVDRPPVHDDDADPLARLARAVLTVVVRGRRERGGPWGEAVLAEMGQTRGWGAVRWAAGGIRAALRERRGRLRELPKPIRISFRIVLAMLATAASMFLVDRYLLTVHFQPSPSMEPTIQVGERFVVDKISTRFGVDRGDVVIVRPPASEYPADPYPWTVRVIGIAGDTISCTGGRVLRNGTVLDEPYLSWDPGVAHTDCATVTVPPGRLYLLGDRREVSFDSRHKGFFPEDAVIGRMLFRLG